MSELDDATGRFFEEAQELLAEGQITVEGIARLRNVIRKDWTPLDIAIVRESFDRIDKGYILVSHPRGWEGICCLKCHRTSWNPDDVKNRYCSVCHVFFDDDTQRHDQRRRLFRG